MTASKRRRVALAVIGALVVVIGGVTAWLVTAILPIGTGIAAWMVCSDVFVAGRPQADLLAVEVPQASFVRYHVDRDAETVTASAFGLQRKRAVYRPGLGCALTIDTTPDALRAQGFSPWSEPDAPPAPDPAAPWPRGAAVEQRPDPAGLDRAALEAAFDDLFDADAHPDWNSRAAVVVHRGRIVGERYAPGFDADTPQLGWSMTKSVTSALVGTLVRDGVIDVDAPVGFEAWSGDGDLRGDITWDDLLRMSSGLEFHESYGLRSDVTVMLFDTDDAPAIARDRPLAHDIDTHWSYSSGTTNLIQLALREHFADDSAYHRAPYERLFFPLGMRSAVIATDPRGTYVGSSYMLATPRDWARFGLLFLREGEWFGTQVLDPAWVARSVTPTPTHPTKGYGMQWWLNAADDLEDRPYPGVPPDAYFASGHQGQMVLVVPSRDAVIVRMGMTNGAPWDRDGFASAVLAALPE